MRWRIMFLFPAFVFLFTTTLNALPYDPEQEPWNLNTNQTATDPLQYSGAWEGHTYMASPSNWRFPVYTIFLDRIANGDPTNDNANGTAYEHDLISNQFRNGGDIAGLLATLDYIQGMGIKGLYLAGSPFINQPWAADSYSPLDMTLLDHHFGNITAWRQAITEIHKRGMYVIMDNTMSTLGDLIGFEGYLNTTTPFSYSEHNAVWKSTRRYHDFQVSDTYLEECDVPYPRFWTDQGEIVGRNVTAPMAGCRNSDFDQYGDVSSFGNYPEWQKQISKFGFVQDRLREWRPSVLDKIKHFSCLTIQMLDIDGFRIDKGLTITVDAQADWSDYIRDCARSVGKNNFFIPGEIVSGNVEASIYVGRGKEPQMAVLTTDMAFSSTNGSNTELYIRNGTKSALDAACFHYSIYRSLCRYLGIDGIYAALQDTPVEWTEGWTDLLQTNDFINQNTGEFDPRHMYGATNQDVFRWPGITQGDFKNIQGLFVTTLLMPGIPILMWGEEQAFYVLENTASNYLFGRSPMTSSLAWQIHGCYTIGSDKYENFPLNKALTGCQDTKISWDHRDPSHPVRNILKRMYELRTIYPALNDGFQFNNLSKSTYDIFLPGSGGTPTETGIWSSYRAREPSLQDFTGNGQGNQSVWMVYGNENRTTSYTFDCMNKTGKGTNNMLLAPFPAGTVVRNLFSPYETYTLGSSNVALGLEGVTTPNGCLDTFSMDAYDFKAFVPEAKWVGSAPTIVGFGPGHDYRQLSGVGPDETETLGFFLDFSVDMGGTDCTAMLNSITIESNTVIDATATIDKNSVKCGPVTNNDTSAYPAQPTAAWTFSANLVNVANGVHAVVVNNATVASGNTSTGAVDRFLVRIGQPDNPMVYPFSANYSTSLLHKNSDGSLYVSHKAAGATKFRYSTDFQSSFSDWMDYTGGNTTLTPNKWSGTKMQAWDGDNVYVQYWSALTASSDHFQIGDIRTGAPRRMPHMYVQGPFNQFSYDTGIPGTMSQFDNGTWYYDFMDEWPTSFQFNEWGINPDGEPDSTLVLGDIDHDFIMDRLPPGSLIANVINITETPPSPFVAWRIIMNDGTYTYGYRPVGSKWSQMTIMILLAVVPLVTACLTVYVFMKAFYGVKFNQMGVVVKKQKEAVIPLALRRKFKKTLMTEKGISMAEMTPKLRNLDPSGGEVALDADLGGSRRSVLIATMEYDIEDWAIKIKIGGLGVMAQLMGKSLGHQDLIWIVPCVQGIDYPIDTPAEAMFITVLENVYEIQVQYHVLRNITYVLLDAPIFRKQSKNEPYPARMDDLESAIYYSAWNQCIAQAITRFNVSMYHINDYHGALAPLYLLPRVIPCALSLHNAEFQGLWPMRTPQETKEVCKTFNIDPAVAKKYVQFGEVFNLLHAAASYLRIHQRGFGACGVSKKYGARSFARYPIFWGLSKIGSLPNPDPTDTAEWNRNDAANAAEITVDPEFEAKRPGLKREAQEWAGLKEDPGAQLFVFVGRWSMQKGIDLIADVFPSILESYPSAQLICVGPVIDLYGRFAALKLAKMMQLYPGRVYSKPEFTALPPFIFSGSDFALIPSRDEPFGLVAVEFGRKGALGVGARVGGLGTMPGWWFTVESMTPKHLTHQFKMAIHDALASSEKTRAMMRARSAKQRFPVAQWVEDLDTLQSTAIKISDEEAFGKPHTGSLQALKSNPSLTNLRTLFTGGNQSTTSLSINQSRHFSNGSHLSLGTPPIGGPQPSWPLKNEDSVWSPPPPSPLSAGFRSPSPGGSPGPEDILLPPRPIRDSSVSRGPRDSSVSSVYGDKRFSTLSYDSVAGGREDFALQKVDPSFTDATGAYLRAFALKLEKLDPKSSESLLCIEENLIKSEKSFYKEYRDAKMGVSTPTSASRAPSIAGSRPGTPNTQGGATSFFNHSAGGSVESMAHDDLLNEFTLGRDYVPPSGLKRLMLYRIKDWPLYTVFLAFGQIIAANSYQISLLAGEVGETALQLYVVAAIYAASSIAWWLIFRRFKSFYCLSLPFIFYGLAFFLIGMGPFAGRFPRGWLQNTATGLYSVASSSGSLFFALNFGDEGGAPIKSWVLRACLVQGTQQIYISALWFWGSSLVELSSEGVPVTSTTISNTAITAVTLPICFLMWGIGLLLFFGLPQYYRQTPGAVPSFYKTIFRRKIILWFFVYVIIQNYWLSSPYGRNWRYLWTTQHAPTWAIALLVIAFFIGIWIAVLFIFARLSKSHSWILPVFAIGLGAPRWCQMLWSTSGMGQYLPWAGSAIASALLGRCMFLWLGILDAIQGVGFGMILLQTMTRFHICFTLLGAQVLGSIFTILARATAPDNTGPGDVFPNFALGTSGLHSANFWICLIMQIAVCVGFAAFFRKEQLSKP